MGRKSSAVKKSRREELEQLLRIPTNQMTPWAWSRLKFLKGVKGIR